MSRKTGPSTPEAPHPLVGREVIGPKGQRYTIDRVLLGPEYKPYRNNQGLEVGTYEGSVEYHDANGQRHFGPVPVLATEEQIIEEFESHGFRIVTRPEDFQNYSGS